MAKAPTPAAPPPPPTAAAPPLADLGVEITPAVVPAMARAKFRENKMAGEPATDRKLTLESGRVLRERMVQTAATAPDVATPAELVAPTGITLTLSLVALGADGKTVARNAGGGVKIAPAHEVLLLGENLARLGTAAAVAAEIDRIREEAAARADAHFEGMALLEQVLAARE